MMPNADDRDVLLGRVSIAAVLEQLGGSPRHRSWACPSANHAQTGKTPPVSIDEARGLWHCHGCGLGGTAIDALVLGLDLTVAEAFTRLRETTGLERHPTPTPRREKPPVAQAKPLTMPAPTGPDPVLDRFLVERGWRPDVAANFGLHTVTRNGKRRIRFPFVRDGRVSWWQDRALGDDQPKYLGAPDHPQQPYALDLGGALDTAHDTGECWIVEGVTDVVALGHLADPGKAPAVIGVPGVTFAYLPALAAALTGIIVAIVADADPEGDGLRARAAQLLEAAGAHPVQVRLPSGINDLDDLRRCVDCDDDKFTRALIAGRYGSSSLPTLEQVLAEDGAA